MPLTNEQIAHARSQSHWGVTEKWLESLGEPAKESRTLRVEDKRGGRGSRSLGAGRGLRVGPGIRKAVLCPNVWNVWKREVERAKTTGKTTKREETSECEEDNHWKDANVEDKHCQMKRRWEREFSTVNLSELPFITCKCSRSTSKLYSLKKEIIGGHPGVESQDWTATLHVYIDQLFSNCWWKL